MPDGLDISQDVLVVTALIDALDTAGKPDERKLLLARFRAQNDKSRAGLKEQIDNVEKLFEEIAQTDLTSDDLASVVAVALEKKRADGEKLQPRMEGLRQKLEARAKLRDPEAQQCLQESVNIIAGWLALYRDLSNRLLKLAAERRAAAGEILRARPVAGEIDYAELSREHMARYPKIRAALAK